MIKRTLVFLILSFMSALNLSAQDNTPYLVFIKPGSVLNRISDKKSFVTNKGLYLKVLEVHPTKRDLFNVYDNRGVLLYTTAPENIVEISEDIRVYPKVNAAIVYPPKASMFSEDMSFKFNTQFNYYMDSVDVSGFENIYSPLNNKANGNRLEFKTLYQSSFPIEFGLTLSYQNAKWTANDSDINLNSFSFGPSFNYKFYTHEYFNLNANLGAEINPLFQTKSDTSKENYSAFSYSLGVSAIFPTMFGNFNLGAQYRNSNINLSDSTMSSPSGFAKNDFAISSLGFMLGYIKEWEL